MVFSSLIHHRSLSKNRFFSCDYSFMGKETVLRIKTENYMLNITAQIDGKGLEQVKLV